MALVDLKSNLANFRSEFVTPSVESQAIKNLNQPSSIKEEFLATDSRLDIDRRPPVYTKATQFTKPFVDASVYNRDDNLILKYTGRTRFTTKFVDVSSKLNVDGVPNKFINSGFNRLSVPRFINRSQFNIDGVPNKFSPGMFIPSKFTDKKVINVSKYNLDNSPDKFSNVGLSKLSLPRFINRSLLNIDSVLTKFSPTGVYLPSKFNSSKEVNKSRFNIDSNPDKYGNDVNKTKYKGISGNSFKFPALLTAVFRTNAVELKNSKFGSRGSATVENQLGAGSLFHYTIKGAKNNKLFSSRGYGEQLKYGDAVRGGRGSQESNSLLYRKATEQNSPSAVEEQYKKFNLRDEAFNYSYINRPLILRGIQRKGKEKPNRWGVDALVNFDSGLVRGGITAAVERAANDTARIAKWIASPKGLLWVVKQVGLGLSNPKVEATGGPLTRQTRIHTGVASLLSVPTTAFGLHFTRHGIPFLNETASYEKVINSKNNNWAENGGILRNSVNNRLIALKAETGTATALEAIIGNKFAKLATKLKLFKSTKQESVVLSSLGGPQSVYGLGFTIIRLQSTTAKAEENARKQNYIQVYDSGYGYYPDEKNKYSTFSTSAQESSSQNVDSRLIDKSGNKIGAFSKYSNAGQKMLQLANKPLRQSLDSKAKQEATLLYNLKQRTSAEHPNGDVDGRRLIKFNNPEKPRYLVGATRAKTGKDTDAPKSTNVNGLDINAINFNNENSTSLQSLYDNAENQQSLKIRTPNSNVDKPNPFKRQRDKPGGEKHDIDQLTNTDPNTENKIKQYATLAYGKLKDQKPSATTPNDFRNSITDGEKFRFVGKQDADYYSGKNLEGYYGFSKAGPDSSVTARGDKSFILKGNNYDGTGAKAYQLSKDAKFTGDKITAIDIIKDLTAPAKIYESAGAKDFIKFYFADGEMTNDQLKRVMVFRATISGLTDSFNPGWSPIQIMGRPDSAYRYDSFERSISFEFKAYAMSRSEMIPMWRKLNYLASFTAPDVVGNNIAGPFMRLTLGDLYVNCPGFIESLSYTIPDDSTWDIADDGGTAKELPTMVDVSVGYKIIGTHRPLNMGRMYALSNNDSKSDNSETQWLSDSAVPPKSLTDEEVKQEVDKASKDTGDQAP